MRYFFQLKLFPHLVQLKGRSPVWIRWWVIRFFFQLKFFPHSVHVNGRSPVWICWCLARSCLWLKFFWHTEPSWQRGPWCGNTVAPQRGTGRRWTTCLPGHWCGCGLGQWCTDVAEWVGCRVSFPYLMALLL
uniref:Uncharacterized protein n=1 Tax=Chelonoidis abingdonii TaxID=106734 RepID=A0A8C0GUC5_CHEAB